MLIVITIMILILFALIFVKAYFMKQLLNCQYNPTQYCSNKWTCASFTPRTSEIPNNSCFNNDKYSWRNLKNNNYRDGLANCLYGPTNVVDPMTCTVNPTTNTSDYSCLNGCPTALPQSCTGMIG